MLISSHEPGMDCRVFRLQLTQKDTCMTSQMFIPVKAISELESDTLDLTVPARCSRCNKTPAQYFEAHPLRFRAGMPRRTALIRKFSSDIVFRLRLPLCSECYAKNFTEAPETLTHDSGELGTLARWRAAGMLTASLIAGVAFILLMNLFPLPASLSEVTNFWLYPIGISVVIFMLTLGLTELKNRSLKKALHTAKYDIKLHRAYVIAATLPQTPDPAEIAVFVEMGNESWLKECADNHGWEYRVKENQPEKENQQ